MLMALPVLAAAFYGTITISNNSSTTYAMLPVVATINNSSLASNGYMNTDGLDTKIAAGSELPRLLATDKTLFAMPVSAGTTYTATFTTNNSPADFAIVLGGIDGSGNFTYGAALQADGFTIEMNGFFDTSGSAKRVIFRDYSGTPDFSITTGSGLITAGWEGSATTSLVSSSSNHTVSVYSGASGNVTLTIDGTSNSTPSLGNAPGAAGVWEVIFSGIKYLNYYKHSQGGTVQAWYQPNAMIIGTDLPNRQGASYNATISWGTNPATINATFSAFAPVSQSTVSGTGGLTGLGDNITSALTTISNLYTELNITLPGANAINALLDGGGIPRALFWFPMLFGVVVLLGFFVYWPTDSLFVQFVATEFSWPSLSPWEVLAGGSCCHTRSTGWLLSWRKRKRTTDEGV